MDDFSTLAVEKCLLEPLSIIFSSRIVDSLSDGIVEAIAAEDESSKLERGRLALKVNTLQSGLKQLHRLDRHNISGKMYAGLVACLKLMNIIATKVIDEDISEENLSTTSRLTGKANTESPTKAPSLTSPEHLPWADTNDTGMDPFTAHEVEITEPLDELEVSSIPQEPKKKKKKHPGAAMWE